MKKIFSLILISFLFMITGCQSNINKSYEISDAELIDAIANADKVDISIQELPMESRRIIEDIIDYENIGTMMAVGLGYEASMAGLGHRSGHRSEIYFDLDGRRLNPRSDWKREDYDRSDEHDGDWKCFGIVYPISFNMPDGTVLEVTEDSEDGWSGIKLWYEQNPNSDERPSIQFPIQIIFDDNDIITVNDEDELKEAYSGCRRKNNNWNRDEGWSCFDLVYPITYIMPDGSELTVTEDTEDGWSDLKSWYEANPDSDQRPELQYPVDITFETENGSDMVTINNEDEMIEAKDRCWGDKQNHDWSCFDLVYPITYIMPDGSELTVTEDTEDGWSDLKAWYEANPDSDQRPELQYPVDIIFDTEGGNETLTINNENEMIAAKERCRNEEDDDHWGEGEESDDEGPCYEFEYPITYIMPDGTEITIETEEDTEGWNSIRDWYVNNPDIQEEPSLQYPVNLLVEGGNVLTIDNEAEMLEFEDSCREGGN